MSDHRIPAENHASVLTPPGRGAIAVIAAIGPAAHAAVDAHFRAANGRRIADQPINRIAFGHWGEAAHAEEVIVCRQAADRLELHCHGGVAAVTRITNAFAAAGCRLIPWQEWIAAESPDPLTAEADVALAQATTARTAAILLDQRHGALRAEIEVIVAGLSEAGARPSTSGVADATNNVIRDRLTALLHRVELGRHLTQPWQVALAGRPNVGKSSLINAILGYQRAIVFDQPGTTRDVLAAETAIEGWPVRLTDAAGIRANADDAIEAEGVSRALRRVEEADLVIWILDAGALTPTELADPQATARQQIAADLDPAAAERLAPLIVLNKSDLIPIAIPHSPSPGPNSATPVSALHRTGLDDLLAAIAHRLVPPPPAPGEPVPFTPRQIELLHQANHALADNNQEAAKEFLNALLAHNPLKPNTIP